MEIAFLQLFDLQQRGFHAASVASNFPDRDKMSNKTFLLSFISLKSIRHHAVIMYKCSNVEISITSRTNSSFFRQYILFCEHKLLR